MVSNCSILYRQASRNIYDAPTQISYLSQVYEGANNAYAVFFKLDTAFDELYVSNRPGSEENTKLRL